MLRVELNGDIGEQTGNEAGLVPFLSSANIACCYHAGNEESMIRMVEMCLEHRVNIGAHPSYPDRENFGRSDMIPQYVRLSDLRGIIFDQLEKLDKVCQKLGACLHHVKPHGALYNRASQDQQVAKIICTSIFEYRPELILYGMSNCQLMTEASKLGLQFCNEVFADRTYRDDGTLTPRGWSNALITNLEECITRVKQMVSCGTVKTISGKSIAVIADTICIHSDSPKAIEFAKAIHQYLS